MAHQSADQNWVAILDQKIKSKQIVVGVIGLGYVGLPLILRFSEEGFKTIGLDIDSSKINQLNEGQSYIRHISSEKIKEARAVGFQATADFSRAQDCDALIICVPTPLGPHRDPDISFIVDTMNQIKPHLRPGQILSLESTTYPGTTDEVLLPFVTERGLKPGDDFFLIYSPEREDPANPLFNTKNIPKVCGGHTDNCLKIGQLLYGAAIDKVVPVSSTRAAEMTKLLENIHRSVNIGLVNEMKIVADRMNIDIHEVIRAAATKPFGFTAYYPGPGLGGHCIPIDPFYLTWKAKEYGVNTRFIELAGEVNTFMPQYVFSKITEALNERELSVKGSKVLMLGIAYKKNVDDMRESPSVHIMENLRANGAEVAYSDPYLPVFPKTREHHFNLKSTPLTAETLQKFDCVVVATDHQDFDYALILEHSRLIVDSRGVYLDPNPKVVKA